MTQFPPTPLNKLRRLPARGAYDKETIYAIVDEALICHVGFVADERPFVIPTIHARVGDTIYLHGARASRLLKEAQSGRPLCVTVTHLDGIVFARSVFHHSMNYRSAMLFGRGALVTEPEAKLAALTAITEHVAQGRWDDARRPSPKEVAATNVIAMPIDAASAKTRSGPPGDEEEDYALPIWAGVLPLSVTVGAPEPDPRLTDGIATPAYVRAYRRPGRPPATVDSAGYHGA